MRLQPEPAWTAFVMLLGSGCLSVTAGGAQGIAGATGSSVASTGDSAGGTTAGTATAAGRITSGNAFGSGSGGCSGTSGSTIGGAAGTGTGGCDSQTTSDEFDSCASSGVCGCPYQCVADPLGSFATPGDAGASDLLCEQPCQATSDCVSIATDCVNGLCALVACGGSSGNGAYSSTCAIGGEPNGGTCAVLPAKNGGAGTGVCLQAGLSDGGCNLAAGERSQLDELCLPGFLCSSDQLMGKGAGACHQLCDAAIPCPASQNCQAYSVNPLVGICR